MDDQPGTRPRQNLLLLALMAAAYAAAAVVLRAVGDGDGVGGVALSQDILLLAAALLCLATAARGRDPEVVDARTRTAGAVGIALFALALLADLLGDANVSFELFVLLALVMALIVSWAIRRPRPRVSSRRAELEARRDRA